MLTLLYIMPLSLRSQDGEDNDTAATIVGGLFALGAGVAAMELIKEQFEQKAVEQILSSQSQLVNFELKSNTLDGTKLKDISSVRVMTFEITNLDDFQRSVLFAFLSEDWTNNYGVGFEKIQWKLFSKTEWNQLMQAYIQTASKQEISIEAIAHSKIVNKGVKQGNRFILDFAKIGGDVYYTNDYSEEFKLVFNERSLGLYLKPDTEDHEVYRAGGVRGDLVQISRKAIIKAHRHLNNQSR